MLYVVVILSCRTQRLPSVWPVFKAAAKVMPTPLSVEGAKAVHFNYLRRTYSLLNTTITDPVLVLRSHVCQSQWRETERERGGGES